MARNQRLTKEEIQEDKFIEVVLTTFQFLKENLRTIVIIVGVVFVGVAAYAAYYQNQENRRADATVALREATETYQTAETTLFDTEKLEESEEALQTAQTQLRAVFEKYPNTRFADTARYQYANALYYQGRYAEARTQFQQVIDAHQPENQIYALYAQKAIGNTHEQEGDYANAIAAYQAQAFPPTPQLSPEIRGFVLAEAKFNQALVHEKMGDADAARATHKEITDEFRTALEAGIEQTSMERIQDAKVVIAAIADTLDTAAAERLETEKQYYQAYLAYTAAIRTYKVDKDIQGGMSADLRKQIGTFETEATTLINNIQAARRLDELGKVSSALYNYDAVVDFEKLGLSRRIYENALLHYKRLGPAE